MGVSCVEAETNSRIRAIWERFLDYELGHVRLVADLFEKLERFLFVPQSSVDRGCEIRRSFTFPGFLFQVAKNFFSLHFISNHCVSMPEGGESVQVTVG